MNFDKVDGFTPLNPSTWSIHYLGTFVLLVFHLLNFIYQILFGRRQMNFNYNLVMHE